MTFAEYIISLIAPHYCLGCDASGVLLCNECVELLPPIPPRCYLCGATQDAFRTCVACRRKSNLYQAWAVTEHSGVGKTLVHRLKFARGRAAACIAANAIVGLLPKDAAWLATFVPTASSRVRQRGFDQAQLIARDVARRLDCGYAPLLVRIGQGRQVGQTRKERMRQMMQAFQPVYTERIRGRHILLIDDVLTTGSTLEAAAATLKTAGARRVSAAVFAVA